MKKITEQSSTYEKKSWNFAASGYNPGITLYFSVSQIDFSFELLGNQNHILKIISGTFLKQYASSVLIFNILGKNELYHGLISVTYEVGIMTRCNNRIPKCPSAYRNSHPTRLLMTPSRAVEPRKMLSSCKPSYHAPIWHFFLFPFFLSFSFFSFFLFFFLFFFFLLGG